MSRSIVVALAFGALIAARGQGISGVTRRTPAIEKQAPARRFFDAAGLNVAGATPVGTGAPGIAARAIPVVPGTQPTQPPTIARSLLARPLPVVTNRFSSRLQPAKRHVPR